MQSRKSGYLFGKGFTLLELLVVVSIIGILASIALPSYMDNLMRARVGASLEFMSAYQSQANADLILDGSASFQEPAAQPMEFLQCVSMSTYSSANDSNCDQVYIEAWPNENFGPNIRTGTTRALVLQGSRSSIDSVVSWRCGAYPNAGSNIDPSLLPASCDDEITLPRGSYCEAGAQLVANAMCQSGLGQGSGQDQGQGSGQDQGQGSGQGQGQGSGQDQGQGSGQDQGQGSGQDQGQGSGQDQGQGSGQDQGQGSGQDQGQGSGQDQGQGSGQDQGQGSDQEQGSDPEDNDKGKGKSKGKGKGKG